MFWRRQALTALAIHLLSASMSVAQDRSRSSAAEIARYEAPFQRLYDVDGVQRKAAVFVPKSAKQTPSPLILAFHGRGGDARKAAESMRYHLHWPEAIVVYPQGLNTPGGPDP